MPPFPVYVFDLDGTLVDSAADICGAILETLRDTPCSGLAQADLTRFIGFHLLDMYQELLPGCPAERYDELIRSYRTIYPARGHKSTRPYEGVPEMLAALPGRKSTATTKATTTVRTVLEVFGLSRHFDHVQGTDGFPHKPAPDVIFKALEGLGARPEECLFVGDSTADMEAGRRAGVKIAAVTYGYGTREAMAKWSPDYWIDQPGQLLPR